MLIPLVLKWAHMVSVSQLKGCIAKTNVCLSWRWCRDFGWVDHVWIIAFTVHGARAWVPAVTIAVIGGVINRIRFVDVTCVYGKNILLSVNPKCDYFDYFNRFLSNHCVFDSFCFKRYLVSDFIASNYESRVLIDPC